jgi:hypothetical protein
VQRLGARSKGSDLAGLLRENCTCIRPQSVKRLFQMSNERMKGLRLNCRDPNGVIPTAEKTSVIVWNAVTFIEYKHLRDLIQIQVMQDRLDSVNLDLEIGGAGVYDMEKDISLTQFFQGRAKRAE